MPVAKTHLSLNVADLDRSVAWYEAFFGQAAHKRRPGYANFDIESPGLKLALNQGASEGRGPLNHLGILVPTKEEVFAAGERLTTAGLKPVPEREVECCYAIQEKVWVRDPDGNQWEVYALLDDQLDVEAASCGCGDSASVCCQGETAQACC
ncbi:MAG: VOC family protein [Fimbriimonas ginsengisoli]|uniref:VOC family protein n=1 Tax=Fimbriimonas ginsengisoli TaxID=1005039 RepID=A0A931LWY2_FIMGI|nr:VOC family protein [Fimbriimonas ginsengisoli]MBI3743906.1 VOC family protein [Chloroflexota bacterium]